MSGGNALSVKGMEFRNAYMEAMKSGSELPAVLNAADRLFTAGPGRVHLCVDTIDADEIRAVQAHLQSNGMTVAAATTNPIIMQRYIKAKGRDPLLAELAAFEWERGEVVGSPRIRISRMLYTRALEALPQDAPLFVQLDYPSEDSTADEMVAQARIFSKIDPARIAFKIPAYKVGLEAIHRLEISGLVHYRTAATAVFSSVAANLAAVREASFIIPFMGRLEANTGVENAGTILILEIMQTLRVLDKYPMLLPASIRDRRHLEELLRLVPYTMAPMVPTIPPALLLDEGNLDVLKQLTQSTPSQTGMLPRIVMAGSAPQDLSVIVRRSLEKTIADFEEAVVKAEKIFSDRG